MEGLARLEGLERLERFKSLGAGKRQAWTPIRSHGCGLGTPVGCEGLANGTLDRPEEAMDLALGVAVACAGRHKKPSMGGFTGVGGLERLEPIDAFAEL